MDLSNNPCTKAVSPALNNLSVNLLLLLRLCFVTLNFVFINRAPLEH